MANGQVALHSPYCRPIRHERGDVEKSTQTAFELIQMRKWERLKEIIQTNPEYVYSLDTKKHRLMIHYLCELVSYPHCEEDDGEISDDDEDDETPKTRRQCNECLRIENQKICDLAQFLIDTSLSLGPTRVATFPNDDDDDDDDETDENGDDSHCSYVVHESILTVRDAYGKTPLHVLCEHSADFGMMKVIFGNTREKRTHPFAPSALSLITSVDDRGSTPLHYISYSRQCPMSSLRLVMDYCQVTRDVDKFSIDFDPTLCKDIDGDTPLHWALDGYMSPRRISELLRHSKAALNVQNSAGKSPFDGFAANFVDSDSWKTHDICGREAWDNIQAYLKALVGWDGESSEWLPLHAMASSSLNFPPVFYDIALHYGKEDLSKPDPKGWFPLHLACQRRVANNPQCDGALAARLLKSYPQATYKVTLDTRQLPVHIAIQSQKPWSLISMLLTFYPDSLNTSDQSNGLWPFLSAGSNNKDTIDTSYRLLRADPTIIHNAIRKLVSKKGVRAARALRKMSKDEFEEYMCRSSFQKLSHR